MYSYEVRHIPWGKLLITHYILLQGTRLEPILSPHVLEDRQARQGVSSMLTNAQDCFFWLSRSQYR